MSLITIILCLLILCLLIYLIVYFKFGYVESDNYVCLVGKTALVTGGSSGLGYEIVLSLASRGCRVIIADKIIEESVKDGIISATDNNNIILEQIDFTSFKSIRNFCEKLKRSETKLDILINNVGIGKAPETPSEDGLNQTFQINYYGPFLLTHLLIDLLKKSDDARIVFTTSVASFMHKMTPASVTSNDIVIPQYRMFDYANAKFLTVVSSDIFANKLKKFNIACNTYHPGVARTTFFRNTRKNLNYASFTDLFAFAGISFLRIFVGVPPEKAIQACINLATSKKFKNTTGIFFGKYFPDLKPALSSDKNFCTKVWSASEKIVKLEHHEMI
ncbi:unnamed protein product [Phyllotreta striolata]|uniref:Uncharacterized protein n=1 Tax=Phyllotreta striolata TaxID=444603 RepID=A0A9N9TSU2_PHYSR|nr:unnamed protein product [Phyllotreta striolata]